MFSLLANHSFINLKWQRELYLILSKVHKTETLNVSNLQEKKDSLE